jgi:hypothetical protein
MAASEGTFDLYYIYDLYAEISVAISTAWTLLNVENFIQIKKKPCVISF